VKQEEITGKSILAGRKVNELRDSSVTECVLSMHEAWAQPPAPGR
jgi:hypothetical protein